MCFSLDAFVFNEHTSRILNTPGAKQALFVTSRRVNQPSVTAITIATVCCQGLLLLNSFPSINSKSNPLAATNVCFLYPSTHLFVKMDSVTVLRCIHYKNEKQ